MPPPTMPAARGDEDPMSPTVMIQSYLRSRGLQPTAQNVHNVLMANAQGNVGGAGMPVIPGLDNQAPPSTDPGVGGQGNVAGKLERAPTRGLPVPPIPPSQGNVGSPDANDRNRAAGSANTSAQPSSYDMSGLLGPTILAGGAAGLGYGLGSRYPRAPGDPGSEYVGNVPPGPSGRVMDVDQPAVTGDRYGLLPPSGVGVDTTPGANTASIPGTPSPMEMAMRRAVAPGGAPIGATATPPITNMPPYVPNPGDIIAAQTRLPPGVTPNEATVAGMPNLTTQPAQSRVGTAEMPPLGRARLPGLNYDPVTGAIRGSPIPGGPIPTITVRPARVPFSVR